MNLMCLQLPAESCRDKSAFYKASAKNEDPSYVREILKAPISVRETIFEHDQFDNICVLNKYYSMNEEYTTYIF